MKKFQEILIIVAISVIPTLLIWLPFFLRISNFWGIPLPTAGMATIVSNYDGPLFLVVAKTFYNPQTISLSYQFPLPVEYYAAHFPLFPLLIRLFSIVLGFPYAMLFVTIISSILATYFFHKFIRQYADEKKALFTTLLFSIFPARWLIVRSVGSAEPLFVAAIIASVYYFQNKKYLIAAVWGTLAQVTKSPAILLFIAYMGAYFSPLIKTAVTQNKNILKIIDFKKIWPIILMPLSLLVVFFIYKVQFGDFLAYFHSGDNIHIMFPPFSIFNYSAPWVGTFWLEEVIFIYLLGALGLLRLIKEKEYILSWFVGIFFVSILFVAHRDILRYALPIIPFIIKAYLDVINTKEFKMALILIAIPIYLFSLAFISQNVMPISNWAPFL